MLWEKTDTRMKPDWLNNSPMTHVEVTTESSYIRCLAVPTLIEWSDGQGIYRDISVRKRKGRTLHPTVCQAKLSSSLNGDCLHGDAARLWAQALNTPHGNGVPVVV